LGSFLLTEKLLAFLLNVTHPKPFFDVSILNGKYRIYGSYPLPSRRAASDRAPPLLSYTYLYICIFNTVWPSTEPVLIRIQAPQH